MSWAKQARFVGAEPNDWIRAVPPQMLAIIGLEDVVRVANYVWSDRDY